MSSSSTTANETSRAANYYARSTGHLPPGLQKDDQDADKASAPTT